MITIDQIRAARGLLNWSQQELAARAGLSVKALNNIERGVVVPRVNTMRALQEALEQAGAEFTEFSGVRRRGERLEVKTYEGPTCLEVIINDILTQLGHGGGEVLLYGIDEKKFDALGSGLMRDYYERIPKLNIRERILSPKSNALFLGPLASYRTLPPEQISDVAYLVYGQILTIMSWGPPVQMVRMRSQAIADAYRKQFEFHWQRAKPVEEAARKSAVKKKR